MLRVTYRVYPVDLSADPLPPGVTREVLFADEALFNILGGDLQTQSVNALARVEFPQGEAVGLQITARVSQSIVRLQFQNVSDTEINFNPCDVYLTIIPGPGITPEYALPDTITEFTDYGPVVAP